MTSFSWRNAEYYEKGWVQGGGKYKFHVHTRVNKKKQGIDHICVPDLKIWDLLSPYVCMHVVQAGPEAKGLMRESSLGSPFSIPMHFRQNQTSLQVTVVLPEHWPYRRSLGWWSSALHFLYCDLLPLYLQWLFLHPERGKERMQHSGKRTEGGPTSLGCRRHNLSFVDICHHPAVSLLLLHEKLRADVSCRVMYPQTGYKPRGTTNVLVLAILTKAQRKRKASRKVFPCLFHGSRSSWMMWGREKSA